MKAAGVLLLVAGLGIVKAALVLLPVSAPRAPFVLAGIGVQILGLVLTFRSNMNLSEER
jgi:uncharacterized membrane protein